MGESSKVTLFSIGYSIGKSTSTVAIFAIAVLALACSGSDSSSEPGTAVRRVESPQTPWAQARVNAVRDIWNFSDAGVAWMEGYDFRQMINQPTWFGSTGFQGWAGAGQAVPKTIMHELSHSYWGVFGSSVQPDLDWVQPGGGATSEGLLAYRADLEAFLRQPPDRFEPLRDRFRNLTNLSVNPGSDLFHFGESEMINMTGGDIDLVPPILRPYFDNFLTDIGVGGIDFDDWPQALNWFQDLEGDDRRAAEELFAIQHFPLRFYEELSDSELAALPDSISNILENEERQRLRDFAEQFADIKNREFALVDAARIDGGFRFWSSYVRDMRSLHQRHPDELAEMSGETGPALAEGFDFYAAITSKPIDEQVEFVTARMGETVIGDLAVLMAPRTLIALFDSQIEAESGGLGDVLTGQVATLRELAEAADQIIAASPPAGATLIDEFVTARSITEVRTEISGLIRLLREAAPERLQESMPLISDTTLLRLLEASPEIARSSEVTPARLLAALGASPSASIDDLSGAGHTLFGNSSGNFNIDRDTDDAFYGLLAERESSEPGLTLQVMQGASLGLFTWIRSNPHAAGIAISNSPELAAKLIREKKSLRSFPTRTIHRLISVDPILAADVLSIMDTGSEVSLIPDVLSWMVYNSYWSDLNSGPAVDLSNDAEFLVRLLELQGEESITAAFDDAVGNYLTAISGDTLEEEYPQRHRETLTAIRDAAKDRSAVDFVKRLLLRLDALFAA